MAARATTLAQAFSNKMMLEFYDENLINEIVNRDYEGEINKVGSKLNMLNFDRVAEQDYTGADMSVVDITENNAVLTIDQQKDFYFKLKTIDNWKSYIKNPKPTVVAQTAGERSKNVDSFVFGLYADIYAGNRVGTDYNTGTVTVDVTTGLVTGSGTTFTSGMVGRGFKATGHSKHYRVKTFTNTTSIVIEDDLDDISSQYTGGAIGAGASYLIQAATKVQITAANLLSKVAEMARLLDEAESLGFSTVPESERWLVVPPRFKELIPQATGIALHVPAVYQELVKKGMITELQGFKVFTSNRLTGNNTDGYRMIAGHPRWMTFAEKVLQSSIEEDLIANFGSAYKDLFVYGGKVTDSRRHYATELFGYF